MSQVDFQLGNCSAIAGAFREGRGRQVTQKVSLHLQDLPLRWGVLRENHPLFIGGLEAVHTYIFVFVCMYIQTSTHTPHRYF
jgi:hypothetical protein